ncbi:MAG: c-type cytochrome [Chitinophagaceae bacterium]
MHKSLIILLFFFITSCANNTADNSTEQKPAETTSQPEDPEATKGLDLIAGSDCFTCHKVSEMSTGPSYEAIASKYRLNEEIIDTLTQRITKGSHGVWGDIPMTAHDDLSKEDARAMVKYIMSLKK